MAAAFEGLCGLPKLLKLKHTILPQTQRRIYVPAMHPYACHGACSGNTKDILQLSSCPFKCCLLMTELARLCCCD